MLEGIRLRICQEAVIRSVVSKVDKMANWDAVRKHERKALWK